MALHIRSIVTHVAIALLCVATFFALDFGFSTLAPGVIGSEGAKPDGPRVRIADPVFHHGLLPRFDGAEAWGETSYRLRTNSLGFKDAAVREVPAKADVRRVILIGDSFTEGVGLPFEDTFAGKLYRAGRQDGNEVEFLNAGVVSYSPAIYYRKIKHLLDSGLQFDEVVVLPDVSDIHDEAINYFCIDEDPQYRAHCNGRLDDLWSRNKKLSWLQTHFTVSERLRLLVKQKLQDLSGNQKLLALAPTMRNGWVIPGYDPGNTYEPLGIEGGIQRAERNMKRLADLLASRDIALTVAVYPWPMQLERNDSNSRQVAIWREFCVENCRAFIDLFPVMFSAKDAHADWYERYFISGDDHYSALGHSILADELARHLLHPAAAHAARRPLPGAGATVGRATP